MPELPEVETIRRGLTDRIIGQKIQNIKIFCDKSFQGAPGQIINYSVKSIRRFGKALIIDLSNNYSLLIHLRMTGQLIYDAASRPSSADPARQKRYAAGHPSDNFIATLPNRQTRVMIVLENGTLYFNDQRKFGFLKIIPTKSVPDDSFIKKLAKEPWAMRAEELHQALQKHSKSRIKPTILDQTVICGLGNIYADEALFFAKIHPERLAGTITVGEAANLLNSARDVMQKSIDSGGSTMATYVKTDGTKGDYLELFAQVFRREGQPCYRCGSPIIKIKVAGRGTHLCPNCQPSPLLDAQSSACQIAENSHVSRGKND